MKILIIDDEDEICKMLKECLHWEGHDVHTATKREDIKRLVEEEGFDVALIDILMPKISGISLIDKVRSASPAVKVIMMTGKMVDPKLLEEIKRRGAIDCMQKPFSLDELDAVIRSEPKNSPTSSEKSI